MAKFEVGEIAIACNLEPEWEHVNGMEVEVLQVGSWEIGDVVRIDGNLWRVHEKCQYVVRWADDVLGALLESELRKKRPPEQPADDEFQQDLKRWLGQGVKTVKYSKINNPEKW